MELRMLANNTARETDTTCSFPVFLAALDNPAPSFAGPPRTLRDHIGSREFGDFGAVLLTNRPPSAGLSDRVAKWRTIEGATQHDTPIQPHPDHAAEDRRFSLLFVATPVAIMILVVIGLAAAAFAGKL
jgi:hypothetical protein